MSPAPLKPSICIVSHNAYGAMTGGRKGHIGGVEWQTSLTAKWLAARGYAVSMITWDEGGSLPEWVDGVRLIKLCPPKAGLPGVRFFHPRWTSLLRALRQADADVYYHNCGEYVTGQIALWCRANRRGFVFSSANDTDCDPTLPEMTAARERILYRYGLRRVSKIIVQTDRQQQLLQKAFGLDSIVIPMPCPGLSEQDFRPRTEPPSRRVMWMARICQQKRPDRFLDVAESCPELEFDLVGPARGDDYAQGVLRRAASIRNVTVHGAVPRDRVHGFYQHAGCFCCSSDYEGFPNTFLEAWSHGLPIVSTFDPDSLIQRKNLGIVAHNAAEVAAGLRRLLETPSLYQEVSAQARRYYSENHTVASVMPRFETEFCAAARKLSEGTRSESPAGASIEAAARGK